MNIFSKLKAKFVSKTPVLSDEEYINNGLCPNCHEFKLMEGPSGGMAMNIACDNCHKEFNVMFGLGTGAFKVVWMGDLTQSRADLYGIKL